MSDATRHYANDLRLRDLIAAHCNQIATGDEFTELQQRLAADAAARRFYLRYMNLESALESYGQNASVAWQPRAPQAPAAAGLRRRAKPSLAAAIACAFAAMVALAWFLPADRARNQPPAMIATLGQLSGSVVIAGSDGHARSAASGASVIRGDTVRTQRPQSAASIVYSDGTRLTLIGETSITCHGGEHKSITVHSGTLHASVAAQPAGEPMRIVTPTDALEILGTRFIVDARAAATELNVNEGRVRLTRLSDGKSLEVPAGQRVISHAQSELALEDIPPTPDEWSVDFQEGLPPDWGSGKLVMADPPSGDRAGVQAVAVPWKQGGPFEVATAERWTHGLFAVHRDSHLHVTFKMRTPGWFNILILTRTADGDPPGFAGNYIFDHPGWWPAEANRWVTATIPLAAFRPLPPSAEGFANVVPFQVLFSSPEGDRGLVISQIAVQRGGPQEVVIKELP